MVLHSQRYFLIINLAILTKYFLYRVILIKDFVVFIKYNDPFVQIINNMLPYCFDPFQKLLNRFVIVMEHVCCHYCVHQDYNHINPASFMIMIKYPEEYYHSQRVYPKNNQLKGNSIHYNYDEKAPKRILNTQKVGKGFIRVRISCRNQVTVGIHREEITTDHTNSFH